SPAAFASNFSQAAARASPPAVAETAVQPPAAARRAASQARHEKQKTAADLGPRAARQPATFHLLPNPTILLGDVAAAVRRPALSAPCPRAIRKEYPMDMSDPRIFEAADEAPRPAFAAIRRGFAQRCPSCGHGNVFRK